MRRLTPAPADLVAEAFAALDRRLPAALPAPVAVALSGGGDSMALLFLASLWARRRGRVLLALTVDHGLQPGSVEATRFAGGAAARLCVPWRALVWTGDKPVTGLPAAARAARHRLLAEAARAAGANVLLFGHTADDRREEALMRAETPAMGRLREWAPSPVWPEGRDLMLLRPLLGVRRADLRRHLETLGAPWLEDPANADPAYLRSRTRAALASAPWRPPDAPEAPPAPAGAPVFGAAGSIALPLDEVLAEGSGRLVSIALACVSGRGGPPRGRAVAGARARLAALPATPLQAAGALITVEGRSAVFARDPGAQRRARSLRLALSAGAEGVFDGRFEITASCDLEAAPLHGRLNRLSKDDRARIAALEPHLRAALPGVTPAGGATALPAPFGGGPARARLLVPLRFAAATGLIANERDIFSNHMAQGGLSPYLHP